MNNRTKDIFSSLFWLLFSIYIAIESYRFDLGKWSIPGPGYFPFGAALLFGIISILFLFKTLRKPSSEVRISFDSKVSWQNVALSLVVMVIYVFLLNKIGFVFCTLLLGVFFLRLVARQRWSTTLIIALSVTLGAHLLFNVLLDAQLPNGLLPF
jgi:putative tricarboxylic transport membrane protein